MASVLGPVSSQLPAPAVPSAHTPAELLGIVMELGWGSQVGWGQRERAGQESQKASSFTAVSCTRVGASAAGGELGAAALRAACSGPCQGCRGPRLSLPKASMPSADGMLGDLELLDVRSLGEALRSYLQDLPTPVVPACVHADILRVLQGEGCPSWGAGAWQAREH